MEFYKSCPSARTRRLKKGAWSKSMVVITFIIQTSLSSVEMSSSWSSKITNCATAGLWVASVSLCLLATLQSAHAVKLPPSIGRCRVKDPEFSSCLQKNVEDAIRQFKDGAPQLGIPKFEPLLITEMVIGEGSGPVNVQQNFKNVELYGLTESKILTEIADLDHDKLYSETVTPTLELVGEYKAEGQILVLPVKGSGRFNVTLYNSKLVHNLTMERYTKKDRVYWKMVDYVVTIQPEKMHYYFENLFEGDERLGTEINKVLNENWESIYNDVRSGYEKSFGLIFKGLTDSLFARVPLKEIFILE